MRRDYLDKLLFSSGRVIRAKVISCTAPDGKELIKGRNDSGNPAAVENHKEINNARAQAQLAELRSICNPIRAELETKKSHLEREAESEAKRASNPLWRIGYPGKILACFLVAGFLVIVEITLLRGAMGMFAPWEFGRTLAAAGMVLAPALVLEFAISAHHPPGSPLERRLVRWVLAVPCFFAVGSLVWFRKVHFIVEALENGGILAKVIEAVATPAATVLFFVAPLLTAGLAFTAERVKYYWGLYSSERRQKTIQASIDDIELQLAVLNKEQEAATQVIQANSAKSFAEYFGAALSGQTRQREQVDRSALLQQGVRLAVAGAVGGLGYLVAQKLSGGSAVAGILAGAGAAVGAARWITSRFQGRKLDYKLALGLPAMALGILLQSSCAEVPHNRIDINIDTTSSARISDAERIEAVMIVVSHAECATIVVHPVSGDVALSGELEVVIPCGNADGYGEEYKKAYAKLQRELPHRLAKWSTDGRARGSDFISAILRSSQNLEFGKTRRLVIIGDFRQSGGTSEKALVNGVPSLAPARFHDARVYLGFLESTDVGAPSEKFVSAWSKSFQAVGVGEGDITAKRYTPRSLKDWCASHLDAVNPAFKKFAKSR